MAVKTTARVKAEGFLVDVNGGETLEYEVSVLGTANFELVDAGSTPAHGLISSVQDAPTSPGVWKRTWPRPGDPIAVAGSHNLAMSFAEATKYTFVVKQISATGTAKTVLDIDYESTTKTDTFTKSVVVTFP